MKLPPSQPALTGIYTPTSVSCPGVRSEEVITSGGVRRGATPGGAQGPLPITTPAPIVNRDEAVPMHELSIAQSVVVASVVPWFGDQASFSASIKR